MWKKLALLLPLCLAACGGGNNAPAPQPAPGNQPAVNQPAGAPSAADKRRARELYDQATAKIHGHDNTGAAELAEQAVQLDPGNGEYHEQLGYAYEKLGRHDDARDAYLRAAELLSGLSRARCLSHVSYNCHMLASAAFRKGDNPQAIRHLRTALEHNPAAVDSWLLLGEAHMNLQEFAAAAEAFGGAAGVALGEQRYLAMSRQGQSLVYAGDNETAHAVLSALIDEGAFGYEAYGWRAYANLALERKDDAERDFLQALQRTTDREKRAEYEAALKAIAESR